VSTTEIVLEAVDSVEIEPGLSAGPPPQSPTPTPPRDPTLAEIDEFEICPTPPELALAICRRVTSLFPHVGTNRRQIEWILEPSAGDGSFVTAAKATWPGAIVCAVEMRPECENALLAAGANIVTIETLEDFLTSQAGQLAMKSADLVLGNPPFTKAEAHLRAMLALMKPGAILAFLLRVGFYESFDRLLFWEQHPEDSFSPIVPRPGFKKNGKGKKGTDSQSYALFCWVVPAVGEVPAPPRRYPHLVWRQEVKKKPRKPRVTKEQKVALALEEAKKKSFTATGPSFDLE